MLACAAVPTGNDDGSTGSVPVSSMFSSAAGSPPNARQSADSAWAGAVARTLSERASVVMKRPG